MRCGRIRRAVRKRFLDVGLEFGLRTILDFREAEVQYACMPLNTTQMVLAMMYISSRKDQFLR